MEDSESDIELTEQADGEWEEWDNDDEENDATKSLFSDAVLPSPEAAFEHDGRHHSFDIRQFKIERRLDDYDIIKVINYIRKEVAAGRDPLPLLAAAGSTAGAGGSSSPLPWSSDDYLAPVLPDDPLLTYDYEEQLDAVNGAAAAAAAGAGDRSMTAASSSSLAAAAAAAVATGQLSHAAASTSSSGADASVADLSRQLQQLLSENTELKLRVAALMDAALPSDVRQELRAAVEEDQEAGASPATAPATASPAAAAAAAAVAHGAIAAGQHLQGGSAEGTSAAATAAGLRPGGPRLLGTKLVGPFSGGGAAVAACGVDAAYFDSYSHLDIHHEMLSDKPRTVAYQQALMANPSLLKGSRVLDVGCGTSILSCFAARAGATAVVGLDGSATIASIAKQVVAANQLDAAAGGPVSIIAGKVEDVDDIGLDKVDVIVSEWMGYALLFESMLDSVLAARDRWLVPGGALLPDLATIYAAGADTQSLADSGFWQDVYGFNMAPVAEELAATAAKQAQALVRKVPCTAVTTNVVTVHTMDLATMAPADQDFTATFELTGQPTVSDSATDHDRTAGNDDSTVQVAAVVLWFDVDFSARFCREQPVKLSTAPEAEVTHWAQAVLPLAQPVVLPRVAASSCSSSSSTNGSSSLTCRLSMARSRSKHRSLDISLEYSCPAASVPRTVRVFTMEVTG